MGNRAVITMSTSDDVHNSRDVGIYLHWNGGRDSVEAFLTYCRLRGFRSDDYGMARLAQIIGNYFGGGLSIGVDQCCRLDCDNWDNGTYIIDNWEIVGRQYFEGVEQSGYDLIEMLLDIDECQPKKEQLGRDFIMAQELPVSEIRVGDEVYDSVIDGESKPVLYRVVGIGVDEYHNGKNVKGVPYVAKYGRKEEDGTVNYAWNSNNYLMEKSYRVRRSGEECDAVGI